MPKAMLYIQEDGTRMGFSIHLTGALEGGGHAVPVKVGLGVGREWGFLKMGIEIATL